MRIGGRKSEIGDRRSEVRQGSQVVVHSFDLSRTSNTARDRKKQTSNSMKKLTCPKMSDKESVLAQANARRTGANPSTIAETTTTRASTFAKFPLSSTDLFSRLQSNPS